MSAQSTVYRDFVDRWPVCSGYVWSVPCLNVFCNSHFTCKAPSSVFAVVGTHNRAAGGLIFDSVWCAAAKSPSCTACIAVLLRVPQRTADAAVNAVLPFPCTFKYGLRFL